MTSVADGRKSRKLKGGSGMSHAEKPHGYTDIVGLVARTGLSISTINRLKKRGKIPFYQPGGKRSRVLFPSDAIETAADSQTPAITPTPVIEQDALNLRQPDTSEGAIVLSPVSDTSRLPGPMPRWRRHAK